MFSYRSQSIHIHYVELSCRNVNCPSAVYQENKYVLADVAGVFPPPTPPEGISGPNTMPAQKLAAVGEHHELEHGKSQILQLVYNSQDLTGSGHTHKYEEAELEGDLQGLD